LQDLSDGSSWLATASEGLGQIEHTWSSEKDCRRVGCRGLIRGSNEQWIGGFIKYVRDCNVYFAKLSGELEGLLYARRLRYIIVELNIDSVIVVHGIRYG
jgi:hypothetical protein